MQRGQSCATVFLQMIRIIQIGRPIEFFADVYQNQDKRHRQCYTNINTTKGHRLQFLQGSRYHSPGTLFDTMTSNI